MMPLNVEKKAPSIFDTLEFGLTSPHQAELLRQKRKGMNFLAILVAMYCSAQVLVVWFANYLVPADSWFDPTVINYIWNTFLPGSVWFTAIIVTMGLGIYFLLGIVPGLVIAHKFPEISAKKAIKSILISISFRLSFFFAIASIPTLITLITPWTLNDPYTVIWVIGVLFGFVSAWITTGRIAENYGTSKWKGILSSVLMTLVVLILIGLFYVVVIYNID